MKQLYPYFSQSPLDRLDHLRFESAAVEALLEKEDTLFVLLSDADILHDGSKYLWSKKDLHKLAIKLQNPILLGSYKNSAYFTATIDKKDGLQVSSIRSFVQDYNHDISKLGIIAQAASVLQWHKTHLYCSKCGGKSSIEHAGWRRRCIKCHTQHFPRVDPVVIMLTTFEDYCLLGQGVRNRTKKRYSCLAGYMESGESIEEAAKRELFEEAGVIGTEVRYISSQPWPFPFTLMIGVHVRAKNKKLTIDTKELVDAKWVHKDELRQMLQDEDIIPGKIAIAREMLEIWADNSAQA